jgi:hypothetical protein
LNLVQAVELSLKECLRRKHPVLIYENVDKPKRTVSISQALARIESPFIADIGMPDGEKRKIESAVKLRNQITHHVFEITEELAIAKFAELFAFLVYFQSRHLGVEIESVLDQDLLHPVVEIEKCFSELRKKALARIREEEVEVESVWACPECFEDTLVFNGIRGTCYLCRQSQRMARCPQCGRERLDFDVHDFSSLIDADYDGGEYVVYNDYGYPEQRACSDCIESVKADIEEQRRDEFYRRIDEAR